MFLLRSKKLIYKLNTMTKTISSAAAILPAEPLLFSLHSSQILAGDEQVQAGQPDQSRILVLCGTTGKRFLTHAYEHGPFQLADGQRLASVKALGDYFARQHRAMLPVEGAAMLLGVDGSIQEVRPAKGRTFKLAQLYAALECDYIDVHHPQHGAYQDWILNFDDEGKFKSDPLTRWPRPCGTKPIRLTSTPPWMWWPVRSCSCDLR